MKPGFTLAALLALILLGPPGLLAQTPAGSSSSQTPSTPAAPKAPAPEPQTKGNPFPGNTTNVPILPSGPTANVPEGSYGAGDAAATLPPDDQDPVRSPDSTAPDAGQQQGFSSSQTGLDDLVPQPDTTPQGKGKDDQQIAPLPVETPANDISVGDYYLDNKNWRGALSRFQSALVLDPQDPEVYWGLAECERHMGDYADARLHYLKVLEYDPGSRHAKDARKALRDPEIANAKPSSSAQTPSTPR
jgi:Tetratricopeptide repeat